MGIIIYLNCYNHKHKLQIYQSCKEKMGGGGVAIACSRQEQTQCHLCRSELRFLECLFTSDRQVDHKNSGNFDFDILSSN